MILADQTHQQLWWEVVQKVILILYKEKLKIVLIFLKKMMMIKKHQGQELTIIHQLWHLLKITKFQNVFNFLVQLLKDFKMVNKI
jgi:hypothetical protein